MTHKIKKQLEAWQNAGLLTQEKVQELTKTLPDAPQTRILTVLSTLGAVFIGLSGIFFIAANWEGMSKVLKLFFIFTTPPVFLGLGQYIKDKNHPIIGTAFFLISFLLFGAALALLGQLYNTDPNATALFFWWMIGTLPLALWNQTKALAWAWAIVYSAWIIATYDFMSPKAVTFGIAGLIALKALPPLLFAKITQRTPYWILTPLIAAFAWSSLLNAGFKGPQAIFHDMYGLFNVLNPWWHMIIGAIIFAIANTNAIQTPKATKILQTIGAGIFFIAALSTTTDGYARDINENLLLQFILNGAFVAFTLYAMLYAHKRALKNIAVLTTMALIIWFFIRYFSFFWTLLNSSLFFLFGGILLLGLAFLLKKKEHILTALSQTSSHQ